MESQSEQNEKLPVSNGNKPKVKSSSATETQENKPKFQSFDRKNTAPLIELPDEIWLTVLESPCTFPPAVFEGVMLNLIKNPNITSSHLFRADIFYDSGEHADNLSTFSLTADLVRHLKAEYRPIEIATPTGFARTRTMVRQLVPRNPQLDKPLIQTCHFFQCLGEDGESQENIVIYVPHVQKAADMPFYHPEVAKIAFHHDWKPNDALQSKNSVASIAISYLPFPGTDGTLPVKLDRTALRLLQTIHKHGQGRLAGYEKRVHLDQILPQKRYQDTYTRLKATYGRRLSEQWVEVTDPGKHVFEDIGIAAFLIELWRDMYALPKTNDTIEAENGDGDEDVKAPFPGFVDIGCGNGLLVYILLSEGYPGWGFDARERKTWSIFPSEIQAQLKRRILVPKVFLESTAPVSPSEEREISEQTTSPEDEEVFHNGQFTPGTFIVSNHADELTPWTPLLAHLNESAFIAIPCCSHDLSGARFRAPPKSKGIASKTAAKASNKTTAQNLIIQAKGTIVEPSSQTEPSAKKDESSLNSQAAETGSLGTSSKSTPAGKKQPTPSAYATLCTYINSLSQEAGFVPEDDVLRIPSTRNQCIVGRKRQTLFKTSNVGENVDDRAARDDLVTEIVERELGRSIEAAGKDWVERAQKLAKKPGSGH